METRKVAVVFGASGGIGFEVFSLLLEKGWEVYGTYHHNSSSLKDIQKTSPVAHSIACDITDTQMVEHVIRQISQKTNIDTVINTVTSPLKLRPFDQLEISSIQEDIDVILKGTIHIAKAVIPVFREQRKGMFIHLLSQVINHTTPSRMSSYVMAKSAVWGLVRCLAEENKRFDFSVYGVSPSFVETDLLKPFPAKLLEIEKSKRTNQKLTTPQEVAERIYYLLTHPDDFQSGAEILVD